MNAEKLSAFRRAVMQVTVFGGKQSVGPVTITQRVEHHSDGEKTLSPIYTINGRSVTFDEAQRAVVA